MQGIFYTFHVALLALCVQLTACAQNDAVATIEGKASPDTKRVIVFDCASRNAPDTVEVKDGAFSCEIKLTGKEQVYAFMTENRRNPEMAIIEADGRVPYVDLVKHRITGTPLNDKLTVLDDTLAQVRGRYEKLKKQYDNASDEERVQIVQQLMNFEVEVANKVCEVADANQDNIIPAVVIPFVYPGVELARLQRYANSKKPYVFHPLFATVLMYVEEQQKQIQWIGKKFTDVTGKDLQGKEHRLSEYVGKGNYVLVDFWASWCGPCMREMPAVKECWGEYRSKGFDVVGISLDNDASKWRAAIENGGLDWPHISDLGGWKSEAAKAYGVESIPWNILCDGEGKIVAVALRGGNLKAKLAELYK